MKKVKEYAKEQIERFLPNDYLAKLSDDVLVHSENVCDLTLLIASGFGMTIYKQTDCAIGALLHDLGKIDVDSNILNKAGKLDKNEKDLITLHPLIGYQIVKEYPFNRTVLDIVLSHHEKLDGNGYPNKLHANEIPMAVQIVTVADIYSALTEDRIYHKAKTSEEAFRILRADSGVNQLCVDMLFERLKKFWSYDTGYFPGIMDLNLKNIPAHKSDSQKKSEE